MRVLGALGLAIAAVAGCSGPSSSASPSDVTPRPASVQAASIPSITPVPSGYTVSEALALRDAGGLGADQIVLVGYWSNRYQVRSCVPPPQPQGEIDVWCADGEYGITERNEAIGVVTNDYRFLPAEGPHLTPYVPEAIASVLFGGIMQVEFPPVPMVVRGHFDDPRAADCHETCLQSCRERFVIDEILAFDPLSVPPATPPPTPTPFPFPAPAALFGPELCAGDIEYAFVGWTTTAELNIPPSYRGHVFAMVTKDVIPVGSWIDDPAGSGQMFRHWGQQVCYSEDMYIGQVFNNVPMGFAVIIGTGFKEWEDGRRGPVDGP